MKMFKRKSPLQRLGDSIKDSLDPSGTSFSVSGSGSAGKALKAGLVAGGLTALTAASAGISALRRREEGARNDS